MAKKNSKRNRPGRYYKRQLAFIISRLPLEVPVLNCHNNPLEGLVTTLERYLGTGYIPEEFAEYLVFETSSGGARYYIMDGNFGREKYLTAKVNTGSWFYVQRSALNKISLETLFQVANNPKPATLWLTQTKLFRVHVLCETRLLSVIQCYIS